MILLDRAMTSFTEWLPLARFHIRQHGRNCCSSPRRGHGDGRVARPAVHRDHGDPGPTSANTRRFLLAEPKPRAASAAA
jgi:hypothetical protein